MDSHELDIRFDYHAPDDGKISQHERTRNHIRAVAEWIDHTLPDCREKSIVMTKLEEAMMWANAAIARRM
jgi:hypothetical protein